MACSDQTGRTCRRATTYLPVSDRAIAVGDKVKLRAFGSIGIVDAIKDGEAEVRVKALRFREKLKTWS
jgi:hypothetical protein